MRKFLTAIAAAFAVGMFALAGGVSAQNTDPLDANKFFAELESRGVNTPAAFDGKKFLDELESRGVKSKETLDADKFFAELESRGVNMPKGFDGNKFFEELESKGVKYPSMIVMKKK